MKKIVNMFLLFVSMFVLSSSTADAFTFNRMLTVGMEGQDVLELQKILNSDEKTQVAGEGAGSPGNETVYFGARTLQAVKRFQNLHAQDILNPVGLTEGTGFVGSSTIMFLNSKKYLEEKEEVEEEKPITFEEIEEQVTSLVSTVNGTGNSEVLFYPNIFATHAGRKVSRPFGRDDIVDNDFQIGSGIEISSINFFLNDTQLRKGECLSEYVCKIYIPHTLPAGKYTLRTNKEEHGVHTFRIVSMDIPYPQIETSVIKMGGETIIKGTGFGDDMTVYTPFGMYKTDSRNNEFAIELPTGTLLGEEAFEAAFYIENKQGLRSDLKFVTYEK